MYSDHSHPTPSICSFQRLTHLTQYSYPPHLLTIDGAPAAPPPSTAPTYEDYAQRIYPRSKLDDAVDRGVDTDLHLYAIAQVLRDWERIAPWLGLNAVAIDDIRSSGRSAALMRSDHWV